MEKKLKEIEIALEELEKELDLVSNPWEAEKLEKIYVKLWREYHMIERQLV